MKLLHKLSFIKSKKFIALIIILILTGSGYYYYSQKKAKQTPIEFTQVKKQDLKATVSSSGTVTGKDSVDLKFIGSARLVSLNVETGDKVKKGQTIASEDTQDLSIALQQARNTLTDKDATAKQIEDAVKDHSSDETIIQKATRTTAQVARDNAYDAVKKAQRAFQDSVLYAPIGGIITKADPNIGQFVSGTDLIAQIVDDSEIFFDSEVDESDIGKIKLGQKANVTLNSYGDKIFEGTVEEVQPLTKTTSSGATIVVVRINLGKPEINFVQGLNGQASIIYNESKNALTIPQEALKDETTVYIKEGNQFKEVKIKTGLKSDTDIEILEGLTENQSVVLNPQAVKK